MNRSLPWTHAAFSVDGGEYGYAGLAESSGIRDGFRRTMRKTSLSLAPTPIVT
jgi:hypothetical protein